MPRGKQTERSEVEVRVEFETELEAWKAEIDDLRNIIDKDEPVPEEVEIQFEVFQLASESVVKLHEQLLEMLLKKDDKQDYAVEKKRSTDIRKANKTMEVKARKYVTTPHQLDDSTVETYKDSRTEKGRKLPKLELPKFGGDIKEWLSYWSQFEEIHNDKNIATADKFQYLVQSTIEGSRARELVKSYPITADNYPLAVEQLKKRFGNEKMLIKVYVRELLRLVINNAKNEISLSSLFVKLSAQLRALGTLGVTTDKCATVIYPLVESCIPREVLQAWQRDPSFKEAQEESEEEGLKKLMSFLEREVGGEDNLELACGGLGEEVTAKEKVKKTRPKTEDIPTAAALVAVEKRENHKSTSCVFCGRSHPSFECGQADKLSMEEKIQRIRKKKACFQCLRVGHNSVKCTEFVKCLVCYKKHCTVMCPDLAHHRKDPKQSVDTQDGNNKNEEDPSGSTASMANQDSSPEVLLQTLVLKVHGSKQTIITRALIDTGSQKSYVLRTIADKVGLKKVGEEKVNHVLFGGLQTQTTLHTRFKIYLQDMASTFTVDFDVSDVPVISGNIRSIPDGPWMNELKSKKIELTDVNPATSEIGVLIGADVAGRLMTGEKVELKSGPVAMKTLIGWTLMGKLPVKTKSSSFNSMQVTTLHVHDLDVAKLWELDAIGITDPTERKTREELEESAIDHFNSTVTRTDDGRYEVRLPWVEDHLPLPTNKGVAERRLINATASMKKECTLEAYDQVLKTWEESGMIEEVPEEEQDHYGHYLPHRAVYKPNSTTPIRPVFDASSKGKGQPSLNDCMEKGPNMLEQIPTVVTRFRMNAVGVVADILKAFQQISVAPKDRDYLRFLWWTDTTCKKMKIYRHCRVVFGVSSSPFLLGATLKHIGSHPLPDLKNTAEILDQSTYVDNLVTSVHNMNEAVKLQEECDKLLLPNKFVMRGWEFGPTDEDKEVSLLGLSWRLKEDVLQVDLSALNKKIDGPITKRKILSLTHMVFDPIGFTYPVLITPKLMIQETWDLKLGWDTELPPEMTKRFENWRKQLLSLQQIVLPRWMNPMNEPREKWTLHAFTDASKHAYAAVVYLRVEGKSGVTVQLLQAKARVSPLKGMTIPRLELLGCLIGARLAAAVKGMINYPDIKSFFWTDSSTALYWITHVGNCGVFVQRRVDEIRTLTNMEDWNHVAGELNPADLPSRGCSVAQLVKSQWWEGCSWLYKTAEEWPKSAVNFNDEEIDREKKKSVVSSMAAQANPLHDEIVNCKTYEEMIMCMHGHTQRTSTPENETLSSEEFRKAEQELLSLVQRSQFSGVDDMHLRKLPVEKDDNGMLRLRTRLTNGEFHEEFKWPLVLPSKSPVVDALIRFEHERNSHAGVQTLQANLRERFWILKTRRTIRNALGKCELCQRFTAKKLSPITPALPKDRIQASVPFQVTGVDLMGPLHLKSGRKCWVVLYTCAVYRAVHLEVVSSLSTEDFIASLRRFVGRRGRPDIIYSDNGTNFVGCNNLFKAVNWNKVQKYGSFSRIQWRFNPPTAAWWGGWWERLVGVVKQTLRRVLGKSSLDKEDLATVLCDVEGVINQRPLTYVSEDPDDLCLLTPYIFLVGNRSSQAPEADVSDAVGMNKRLKMVQRIREDLRSRFRKEYLGQLTTARANDEKRKLSVGDIVLVGHDGQKRLDWPLGKIMETIPGRDGRIRVVRVRTKDGEFLRPVQRIYPMEVAGESEVKAEDPDHPDEDCRQEGVSRFGRPVKIPLRLTYVCV